MHLWRLVFFVLLLLRFMSEKSIYRAISLCTKKLCKSCGILRYIHFIHPISHGTYEYESAFDAIKRISEVTYVVSRVYETKRSQLQHF